MRETGRARPESRGNEIEQRKKENRGAGQISAYTQSRMGWRLLCGASVTSGVDRRGDEIEKERWEREKVLAGRGGARIMHLSQGTEQTRAFQAAQNRRAHLRLEDKHRRLQRADCRGCT